MFEVLISILIVLGTFAVTLAGIFSYVIIRELIEEFKNDKRR